MMTGHNCAGAVTYPITVGDFILADTSDASLDGVVANFPAMYRQKVGTTDDDAYQRCYNTYMAMNCAFFFCVLFGGSWESCVFV